MVKKQIKESNHKILILGASSDIGIKVVNLFLKNNWNVDAHYFKNKSQLSKIKTGRLKIINANFNNFNIKNKDITFKKFSSNYSSIVNLIGFIDNKSFENTSISNTLDSIKINSLIPFFIFRKYLNKMKINNFGRLLNASSIGVKYGGGKNTFNYSLSKHLLEFFPSNFKELVKFNILINTLRIGLTDTKIHSKINKKNLKKRISMVPMKRMAQPDEIAKLIYYLSSSENTYITNEVISISGGE